MDERPTRKLLRVMRNAKAVIVDSVNPTPTMLIGDTMSASRAFQLREAQEEQQARGVGIMSAKSCRAALSCQVSR